MSIALMFMPGLITVGFGLSFERQTFCILLPMFAVEFRW